ncbi:MAG: hemerythrin domain-containing protein [Candidatus Omnitrophota bacterium]
MHFKWSQAYLLGVGQVDDQHRKLLGILGELDVLVNKKDPVKGELIGIFNELQEYSQYHFKTEEDLMVDHSYEGMKDHFKEHALFRSKTVALKKGLDVNDLTIAHELLFFSDALAAESYPGHR